MNKTQGYIVMPTKNSNRNKIMKITALILLTGLSINGFTQERINKFLLIRAAFALNIANFEYERGFNEGKIEFHFFMGIQETQQEKSTDLSIYD